MNDTRELWRGKRKDNGEWVKGDGIHYPKSFNYKGTCWIDGMHERANDWVPVIPETVGRFTGLTDKSRVKIFEGDIISKKDEVYRYVFGVVRFGKYGTFYGDKETQIGFYIDWSKSKDDLLRRDIGFWAKQCEVIGNIHDNPGLLKGD